MKRLSTLLLLASAAFLASCNADKTTPGYTYMDDMYTSPSLETYEPAYQFANPGLPIFSNYKSTITVADTS